MTRQIKFRAWDEKNKVMVDFSLGDLLDAMCSQWDAEEPAMLWHRSDYKMPVMQYTGLTDSAGKEIYEGDIVHCHHSETDYEVGFGEYEDIKFVTHCGWFMKPAYGFEIRTELGGKHEASDSMTVIGNIYQPPTKEK